MLFVIVLVLTMTVVTGLAVREIVLFARTRTAYGLRRLTVRMTMTMLLLFLLGSILVGVSLFHLATPEDCGNPGLWVAFWGCVGLLTSGILCLVVADMRSITDESRNEASKIWHDIAETIAAHEAEQQHKDL